MRARRGRRRGPPSAPGGRPARRGLRTRQPPGPRETRARAAGRGGRTTADGRPAQVRHWARSFHECDIPVRGDRPPGHVTTDVRRAARPRHGRRETWPAAPVTSVATIGAIAASGARGIRRARRRPPSRDRRVPGTPGSRECDVTRPMGGPTPLLERRLHHVPAHGGELSPRPAPAPRVRRTDSGRVGARLTRQLPYGQGEFGRGGRPGARAGRRPAGRTILDTPASRRTLNDYRLELTSPERPTRLGDPVTAAFIRSVDRIRQTP